MTMSKMLLALVLTISCLALSQGMPVTYVPYGTFTEDAPYNQLLDRLPENPALIRTKFNLYTKTNAAEAQEMDPIDLDFLNGTHFNKDHPTVVVTHGYLGTSHDRWVAPMIAAILAAGEHNVIFVDWSRGATIPYIQAAGNTRIVGAQVHRLLTVLNDNLDLDYSQVHLVGLGVGAHLVGEVGRLFNGTLARISGLDPAAPRFEKRDAQVHLDETDAQFVDVIHTDTETTVVGGIGTKEHMGHLDFFPNGGKAQPGCGIVQWPSEWVGCDHYRAADLFTDSISNACPYRAFHCPSYADFTKGECTYASVPEQGFPSMGWNAVEAKGQVVPPGGAFYSQTSSGTKRKNFCVYHYSANFYTGTGMFADLDNAVVTLRLQGNGGNELVTLPRADYPSNSKKRVMVLSPADLGSLQSVSIGTNQWVDRWWLYAVSINPMSTNDVYTGCYRRWISGLGEKNVSLKSGLPNEFYCPE